MDQFFQQLRKIQKKERSNGTLARVDDSFYKALSAFEPDDIKGKNCHIAEDYISLNDFNNENSGSILIKPSVCKFAKSAMLQSKPFRKRGFFILH